MSPSTCRAALLAAVLWLPAPVLAQAPGPAPVTAARGVETVATVENVDMRTRQVLLRREDGTFSTFRAGPEVRNLPQVKPGDRVVLRFAEAVAVSLAQPGSTGPSRAEGAAALRAAQGERPGIAAAEVIRRRVKITALDPGSGTVSFAEGSNPPQTVVLRRPEMLEFARGLKVGDEVNIAYAEAILLAVTPAPRTP
jgi:hypothetical protein